MKRVYRVTLSIRAEWILILLVFAIFGKLYADRHFYRQWWLERQAFRQAGTPSPPTRSISVAKPNALRIGVTAELDAPYDIPLNPPIEFDGKTRAEVLDLRSEQVRKHSHLIQQPYTPSAPVFSQIADGAPWWGMYGMCFYGAGPRSVEGPAEEARFLMNPFLLVGVDFEWFRMWSWPWRNKEMVTESRLDDPGFPLECQPALLRWWPREARAVVTYELSAYISRANQFRILPLYVTDGIFDLIAYNARDFGFSYLFVAFENSLNMVQSQDNRPDHPVEIIQYLHRGGSCQYPGGCNNMSPATPALDRFAVEKVPARLTIKLWKKRPKSFSEAQDFTFVIQFI